MPEDDLEERLRNGLKAQESRDIEEELRRLKKSGKAVKPKKKEVEDKFPSYKKLTEF